VVTTLALSMAPASGHYLPQPKDHFAYFQTITLTNGQGNYTGYTENTYINGSVTVNSVLPNGTDSSSYQNTAHWLNNQGQSATSTSQGVFTFSPVTDYYVNGTDNETGYTNPLSVWFYINDSTLPTSATFYLLNTPFKVLSTNTSFPDSLSPTGYVRTIYAQGTGSYQRDDSYGKFTASYTWDSYFDPSTGFIVGYVNTEQDSDAAGDGFTITDTLSVTATSYALTPAVAPPSTSSGSDTWEIAALVVFLLVVLVVVVLVVVYTRRRSSLARHSVRGNIAYDPARAPPSVGPPPPSLNFGSVPQPSVQQVIIKETVKVPCQYCGTLIDSTAKACPNCGAPRT
jgi:hypothetical protein